jgi:hypothetical protein
MSIHDVQCIGAPQRARFSSSCSLVQSTATKDSQRARRSLYVEKSKNQCMWKSIVLLGPAIDVVRIYYRPLASINKEYSYK